MSLPIRPFQPYELVVKRLKELGCEIKTLEGKLTGPSGESVEVRYAINPSNGEFTVLDFTDGEFVSPSSLEAIERRLRLELGFPKAPPYDEAVLSQAMH